MKKIKETILSSSESTPSNPVTTPLTTTSSTPSTPSSIPTSTTTSTSFTTSFTLLGTGAVAVIFFSGYFYINRKKPAQVKPAEQVQPKKLHFPTCNKMYVFDPHTAIFTVLTGCGKSHRMLDLLENEYKGHFEYIVILCPTLRYNKIYLARRWIKEDDRVFLVEPGGKLLEWINLLSAFFSGKNILFIVDDMIANETLDKTLSAY